MDSIDQNFGSSLRRTATSNLPEFSELGYQIERELGHNRSGGRVTYLATQTSSYQEGEEGRNSYEEVPVVIKQFQFAKLGASWSDYEAHEREIQLLQQLNSPSIPHYLNSFETPDGFCLVQEYKKAPSLAQSQHFTPQEIKQIAVAVLEVLVYLQQQVPPVIHRDIKPENILVERSQPIKVISGFWVGSPRQWGCGCQ
jgi:serine/threonine protein kinase